MTKIAFAIAAAAIVFTTAPLAVGSVSAKADNLQMAQVELDIRPGRDRDQDQRGRRDRRDNDATVGVGPGGIRIGPREREHCRTVTTTVERDDGRKVTRREQRCD